MRGFFLGIQAYALALRMLFSKKFAWFLLFPMIVMVMLFIVGNVASGYLGVGMSSWFSQQVSFWIEGISWLQWLDDVAGWLVWLLAKLVYFFFFVMFSGYIVLIIMSPVYSWLSERVEMELTGRNYPFSLKQLLRDIIRGILITMRNMVVQAVIAIVLFIISFIPLVGFLTPFLILFVSSYFYGFSFLDYAIERKKLNVRDSVRYVNRNIGETTGVGFIFAIALMIPLLNIFACCFLSLLSVIAGTVVVNNRDKRLSAEISEY